MRNMPVPQRAGHFGLRRRQRNVRWKKSIYLLPAVCDYKRSQTAEYGKSEVLSDADQTALSLSYFCIPCTSSPYVGDEIPEEREAALQIGMILLTLCDVLVVCGPYISAGMAGEIKAAFEKGKEVYWYDGIKYPGELIKIENWREINDEVQIHT